VRIENGRRLRLASDYTRTLRHVHVTLGLILIVAGLLKLYDAVVAPQEDDVATLLQILGPDAAVLGGLWLLSGTDPEPKRLWAAAAFAACGPLASTRF
jgi:hypothetical protein